MSLLLGKGGSRLAEIEEASKKRFFLAPKEGVHADHAAVLAEGKLVDLQPPAPIAEGTEVDLKLVEVDKHDAGSAVGKLDGIDVVVGGAAKLVGKKAKVRVERVLDGVAYATALNGVEAPAEPITFESEAEKPTRAPSRAKKAAETEEAEVEAEAEPEVEAEPEAEEPEAGAAEPEPEDEAEEATEAVAEGAEAAPAKKKTRRGSRGGRNRKKKPAVATDGAEPAEAPEAEAAEEASAAATPRIHVPDFELGDEPKPKPARKRTPKPKPSRRGGRRRGRRAGRRGGRRGDGRRRGDAGEEEDAPRLAGRPQPEEAGRRGNGGRERRRARCRDAGAAGRGLDERRRSGGGRLRADVGMARRPGRLVATLLGLAGPARVFLRL